MPLPFFALIPMIFGASTTTIGTAAVGAAIGAKTLRAITQSGESKKVAPGDIVGVSRGAYDHYGVYVTEHEVIHYTSENSDIGDNRIMVTDFKRFLRDESSFFILKFPEWGSKPAKIAGTSICAPQSGIDFSAFVHKYTVFPPDEIVDRARSRIGEDQYSLMLNNCEHFAIWCATGIHESTQVDALLLHRGIRDLAAY